MTSGAIKSELEYASENKIPILTIKNRLAGSMKKCITWWFATPAAKIIDFIFGFECEGVDHLAHQYQLM